MAEKKSAVLPLTLEQARLAVREIDLALLQGCSLRVPSGALRRGAEAVESLVFVVTTPNDEEFKTYLEKTIPKCVIKDNSVVWTHDFGQFKAHVCVEIASAETLGAALLMTTGPIEFISKLRYFAKNTGYTLTSRGLFRGDQCVTAKEDSIFLGLGLMAVPPEKRTATPVFSLPSDPNRRTHKVPASDGSGIYDVVVYDDGKVRTATCTCPHFLYRCDPLGTNCKHIEGVLHAPSKV